MERRDAGNLTMSMFSSVSVATIPCESNVLTACMTVVCPESLLGSFAVFISGAAEVLLLCLQSFAFIQ